MLDYMSNEHSVQKTVLFEIVRASIEKQNTLSHIPSEKEWTELFKTAEKQSLVGVCFVGLQRLGADVENGFIKIGMSEMQYLEWMSAAAQVQEKNEVVSRQCVQLQANLTATGFRSSILKGSGIARYYGDELCGFRQSGDIDIYVDCSRVKAIEYAHTLQDDVDWDYKHLHLNIYKDTAVELHYVPEVFMNLVKNRKLQKWFADHHEEMFVQNGQYITPGLNVNLFYILVHIYRHFLFKGVGLRQLMDYYFLLSSPSVTPEMRQETMTTIMSFGMMRFTRGVMWILQEVFGLQPDCQLCESDEIEGHYILGEVMEGGNFGHYDKRLDTVTNGKFAAVIKFLKHNFHLLARYPQECIWAPIWIVYHWSWKRLQRV